MLGLEAAAALLGTARSARYVADVTPLLEKGHTPGCASEQHCLWLYRQAGL